MKIVKNIRIKYPIPIDNNTNEVFHFSIFNINVQGFHPHKLILQVGKIQSKSHTIIC